MYLFIFTQVIGLVFEVILGVRLLKKSIDRIQFLPAIIQRKREAHEELAAP